VAWSEAHVNFVDIEHARKLLGLGEETTSINVRIRAYIVITN
jgi:hypothetical protein